MPHALPGSPESLQLNLTAAGDELEGHPVHAMRWTPPEGGTGPPVVAVHGLGGSHLDWAGLAPILAERIGPSAVWAPDLAGFGRTAPLPSGSGVQANLAMLERIVRRIGQDEPVLLIGNSMGGLLSLLLAGEHPEIVSGLVLISPASPLPVGQMHDSEVALQFALSVAPVVGERMMRRWAEESTPEEQVTHQLELCGVEPSAIDPGINEARLRLARERRELPYAHAVFLEATRSLIYHLTVRRSAIWHAAERVPDPVLVVQGGTDRLVSVEQSRDLAARHPSWSLRVYADHGHVPMIDAPEKVADDISLWLRNERLRRTRPA